MTFIVLPDIFAGKMHALLCCVRRGDRGRPHRPATGGEGVCPQGAREPACFEEEFSRACRHCSGGEHFSLPVVRRSRTSPLNQPYLQKLKYNIAA